MRNFRRESQQSRRDKLRIQQQTSPHHLDNLEHYLSVVNAGIITTPDLVQIRNVKNTKLLYDQYHPPSASEMLDYSTSNSNNFNQPDSQVAADDALFNDALSSKLAVDPQTCVNWRTLGGSQSCSDWVVNYGSGSGSNPFYENTLQDVTILPAVAHEDLWEDGGNEVPAFGDHHAALRLNISSSTPTWIHPSPTWNGDLGFLGNKSNTGLETLGSDSNSQSQGLSLSLWSKPHVTDHFGEQNYGSDALNLTSTATFSVSHHLPKPLKSGSSLQDVVGTCAPINSGPLGPFTGYATILKSSKFLKPAQQLLDELCAATVNGPSFPKACEQVSAISEAETHQIAGNIGCNSTLESWNEISSEGGSSHHPEYQQTKTKLLYMHEEICRRYKQHNQQMHMVVSSFESVAGLNAATPYISLALKRVSKQFGCLKNAIAEQLKHISKTLGEGLASKNDITVSRLKLKFHRHKSSGGNIGFLGPQQHIWRPQRGLPEHAVAILRAWLFEHFLHPYPTDTDKHMLATQTGLTRNQVSNWFINARVRVWKPMVEEIHMLETKGLAEKDLNSTQLECSPMASSDDAQEWSEEKRSRTLEAFTQLSSSETISPYPYQTNDIGELGPVSLTLGLRHTADTTQQQQQSQVPDKHLRQRFGGQMIYDFVG